MLSDERLHYIAGNPDSNSPEAVEMAREILRYRCALAEPYAIIEPLGMQYISDGAGAMVFPPRYRERNDVCLYRLNENEMTD